jgi:hypothetical protein
MIKNIFNIAIIISFVYILIIGDDVYGGNEKIKRDDAVKIAENEALRLGYEKADSMDLVVAWYNTSSNHYLTYQQVDEYSLEKKNKLKNKEYWAVFFSPRGEEKDGYFITTLGGNICIFIDAMTGEILTEIRGK